MHIYIHMAVVQTPATFEKYLVVAWIRKTLSELCTLHPRMECTHTHTHTHTHLKTHIKTLRICYTLGWDVPTHTHTQPKTLRRCYTLGWTRVCVCVYVCVCALSLPLSHSLFLSLEIVPGRRANSQSIRCMLHPRGGWEWMLGWRVWRRSASGLCGLLLLCTVAVARRPPVCMRENMWVEVYVCICVHVCICVYVCVWVCVCIHIQIGSSWLAVAMHSGRGTMSTCLMHVCICIHMYI